MNRIDLTQLGGLPLTQNVLDYLQQSYTAVLGGVAAALGNKIILSGVVVGGSQVSDGVISYNGEILKFKGGSLLAYVDIVETPTSLTFKDGSVKPVYYERYATCVAIPGFAFADLKPAGFVPAGVVVMWSGAANAVPAGWQLHTPLAGKFVVGYDATDADYNAIGNTGGEKEHTLTVNEVPSLDVAIPAAVTSTSQNGYGKITMGSDQAEPSDGPTLHTAGGGQPHENRPPFYVLAYIIKL